MGMSDIQKNLLENINLGATAIHNSNPKIQLSASLLLTASDKEFIDMYNDKSDSRVYYGSADVIEKVEARAKQLNLC
jgi:hypothetical protein